ncbi:MAG: DUF3892 domain-containing protein [Actinomycetota bacterium]|nr:DUF3892 domain-containing protein [Actinomycetota bacterium]
MAMFTVVRVRKEWSADRSHRHIEGVLTAANVYYDCQQVVASIDAGNIWNTSLDGYSARITTLGYCPVPSCLAKPYLKTHPDSWDLDNLENLPEG